MIISPTIGRKLWFRLNGAHLGVPGASQPAAFADLPMDATVVCVFGDRCVNFLVLDHDGGRWPLRSITLRQNGDAVPLGLYCEWMPYQVSAAKAEHVWVNDPRLPVCEGWLRLLMTNAVAMINRSPANAETIAEGFLALLCLLTVPSDKPFPALDTGDAPHAP